MKKRKGVKGGEDKKRHPFRCTEDNFFSLSPRAVLCLLFCAVASLSSLSWRGRCRNVPGACGATLCLRCVTTHHFPRSASRFKRQGRWLFIEKSSSRRVFATVYALPRTSGDFHFGQGNVERALLYEVTQNFSCIFCFLFIAKFWKYVKTRRSRPVIPRFASTKNNIAAPARGCSFVREVEGRDEALNRLWQSPLLRGKWQPIISLLSFYRNMSNELKLGNRIKKIVLNPEWENKNVIALWRHAALHWSEILL